MDLTTASIIEKNRTATDGVYLLLCVFTIKGKDPIRLVCNNEDYTFKGNLYHKYYFNVGDVKLDANTLPTVDLTVSNITGTIEKLVDANNGAGGATVDLICCNTNVPDEVQDEEHFVVTGSSCDKNNITFKLGSGLDVRKRFPPIRLMKDWCPFRFKSHLCGYTGKAETCDKTLTCCRKLGNNKRCGGEPTIPQGGLYARR